MRNSIWRCSLVIAALSVALFSTGCKSGGWGLPGSSWVSWGKKKPPTSSIAGTRVAPQPPSVTYPPFSSGETSTPSAVASKPSGYPSVSGSASTAPFSNSSGATGGYAMQPTANTNATGYETGPYSTGGSPTAPAQQGFYSPSYPSAGGPAASTADARANTYSGGSSAYGTTVPSSGYPASTTPTSSSYNAPSSYNAQPNTMSQPAAGSSYGTGSAVGPSYGAPTPDYSSAPAASSYPSSTPSTGYPTTPSAGYPTTSTDSSPATGSVYGSGSAYGTAGIGAAVPGSSGTSGYASGAYTPPMPSNYGTTPSAYNVPSGYTMPATSGAASGYATVPDSGSGYSANEEYRPGSTGRNGQSFGTVPAQTASPVGTPAYPSTYAR